jgi:cytokinin dehydrogenase
MHAERTPPISRRSLVRTLGMGTLVLGFDAVAGSWVTSAQAPASAQFDKLPKLDGSLHLDETTRAQYAQDFGSIVSQQPLAVLKPGSVGDIRRILLFARRHGIRIVGRGRGHTTFGQAQLRAGIVIDISTLQTIHSITNHEADVDAGLRWNTLLQATLNRGLMPPALTDYIGQTVGGTLSVGGVGGMMYRHGAQIDNVLELQVITGNGRIVVCSERRHCDLFEAALAGQGQVAVIVRAKIRLVPAPERIRVLNLIYTDLATMTAEATRLMEDERFQYLEGFAFPVPEGRWGHLLQAGTYYTPPVQPDDTVLLAGLHDVRSALQIEDLSFWDFASRVPLDFPVQPHPWIDLMLPYPAVDTFVGQVQQTLKPLAEGDRFSILLIPMKPSRFARPLFRAPKSDSAFGFGILRFMPDDKPAVAKALTYNRMLFDQCRDAGGTHYPISAVRLAREDWKRHYGDEFGRLAAAKCRYDPHNVIGSGPDIF